MANRRLFSGRGTAESDFEGLIGPHFDHLYGRACALTGNPADAEDLLQELCLRVYAHRHQVSQLDLPVAWMRRVLYRLYVDLVRRRQRSPVQLMAVEDAYARLADATASEEPGPERQTEASLRGRRLDAVWEKLSDDEQLLLSLHGIEGLSLAEIQDITGLPLGTIKSRLHRSRVRLGQLLEEPPATGNVRDISNELPRRRKYTG